MMLKLMCAVALYGSVHRIDGASVCRCCLKHCGVGNNNSETSNPGWISTESEGNAYRRVVEESRNVIEEQQPQADRGFSAVAAEEVQKFQKLHPDDSCPICLGPFYEENSSGKVVRTTCNHFFHEKCLTEWLATKSVCPLCRKGLGVQNEYHSQPVIGMSLDNLITLMITVGRYQLRRENIYPPIFLFYLQR
jgi:hypothetical protein